eukprot:c14878_g1_i1.p1 GENE.c14878_g1_i1~~c14878_g1_i1.p1  ORF type:complete len:1253 (-),score=289.23 c14878_g1_i1:69-3827(-)
MKEKRGDTRPNQQHHAESEPEPPQITPTPPTPSTVPVLAHALPQGFVPPRTHPLAELSPPILVNFFWEKPAAKVFLAGSFSNGQPIPMQQTGPSTFQRGILLPRGIHAYKFNVDGQWVWLQDRPHAKDMQGNVVNILDISSIQVHQAKPPIPQEKLTEGYQQEHKPKQEESQAPSSDQKQVETPAQEVKREPVEVSLEVRDVTTSSLVVTWQRPLDLTDTMQLQIAGPDAVTVASNNTPINKKTKKKKILVPNKLACPKSEGEINSFCAVWEGTDQSFAINHLSANTTYIVRLVSRDGYAFTSEKHVITEKPLPPATPAAPIQTSNTKFEVTVAWRAPESFGTQITSYDVLFKPHSISPLFSSEPTDNRPASSDAIQAAKDAGAESGGLLAQLKKEGWLVAYSGPTCKTRIANLIPASVYHVCVRAHSIAGSSEFSGVGIVTTKGALPQPPTNLQATSVRAGSVVLQWEVTNNGGAPVTAYKVELDQTGDNTGFHVVYNGPATSTTVTGLPNGATVRFRVQATNENGTSAWSAIARAVSSAVAPLAPVRPAVSSIRTHDAIIAWPTPESGGAKVTDFELQIQGFTSACPDSLAAQKNAPVSRCRVSVGEVADTTSSSNNITVTKSGPTSVVLPRSDCKHKLTGLLPGRSYSLKIAAVNSVGVGIFSESVSFTTKPTAPSQPSSASLVKHEDGVTIVGWEPSHGNGDPSVTYVLQVMGSDERTVLSEVTADTTPQAWVRHPEGGVFLNLRVGSSNAHGSVFGSVGRVLTAPLVPRSPQLVAQMQPRHIHLSWSEPWHNGSPITRYHIWCSPAPNTDTPLPDSMELLASLDSSQQTPRLEYQHTAILPVTRYAYSISAVNAVGEGPQADVVQCESCAVPPSKPDRPVLTKVHSHSFGVQWSSPCDNGAPITSYSLQLASASAFKTVYVGPSMSYTVSELVARTGYKVRVVATNEQGSSVASDVLSVVTRPDVPHSPTALTHTALLPTIIKLKWNPPGYNGGDPVTEYHVMLCEGSQIQTSPLPLGTTKAYSGPATNCRISNLSPGQTYSVCVRCSNDEGMSSASGWLVVTTPGIALPPPPSAVVAVLHRFPGGKATLRISWTAVSNLTRLTIIAVHAPTQKSIELSRVPSTQQTASIGVEWSASECADMCVCVEAINGGGTSRSESVAVAQVDMASDSDHTVEQADNTHHKPLSRSPTSSTSKTDPHPTPAATANPKKILLAKKQKPWVSRRTLESLCVGLALLVLLYVALLYH